MEQEIKIIPEVEEQITSIEKEQGVFPQGTINITANGETDVSAYATANVNVAINLQDKEVSITSNGETTIQADTGYVGLNSVSINTNVPPAKYSPQYIRFQIFQGTDLTEETRLLDTSKMTTFENMFNQCPNLESVDISGFDTSSVTSFYYMFNGCPKIKGLNFSSFNTDKVTTMYGMFYGCFNDNQLVDLDLSSFTGQNKVLANVNSMFSGCQYLKSVNLSNLEMRASKYNNYAGMFNNCTRLEALDISSIDFLNTTNAGSMFTNCGTQTSSGLTRVIVKDAEAQNWVLTANNGHPNNWSTANVIIKS